MSVHGCEPSVYWEPADAQALTFLSVSGHGEWPLTAASRLPAGS
jgi:hypothetical protein